MKITFEYNGILTDFERDLVYRDESSEKFKRDTLRMISSIGPVIPRIVEIYFFFSFLLEKNFSNHIWSITSVFQLCQQPAYCTIPIKLALQFKSFQTQTCVFWLDLRVRARASLYFLKHARNKIWTENTKIFMHNQNRNVYSGKQIRVIIFVLFS